MKIRYLLLGLFSVLLLEQCREKYVPEETSFEKQLVVDGMLTDQPGPYTVKLTWSTKIKDPIIKPYANCYVIITDNTGYSEILEETEPGVYKTTVDGIQGIAGNAYKLIVETPEGEIYESKYLKMKAPIGIDSIYAGIEYKQLDNDFLPELPGYRFYLDTKETYRDSTYFLWILNETYEYRSEFLIYAYIEDHEIYEFYPRDAYYTCYKTQNINEFFVATTEGLSSERIISKPLHFVGTDTKRLQVLYSLVTKQYVIDKEAYDYWLNVNKILSDRSFISSSQPFQLQGNVYNINNASELVLGYFNICPEVSRRDYFERPDLKFHYEICFTSADISRLLRSPGPYPFYLAQADNGAYLYAGKKCFDCRMHGGTLEKPAHWPKPDY